MRSTLSSRGVLIFAALTCASTLIAFASACDPNLNIVKGDGEGGSGGEGGPQIQPSQTGDAATPTDDASGPNNTGDGGGDSGPPIDNDSGPPPPTGHKIDGVNDFAANEKLVTTSLASGYEAYVAWDAQRIIFGMDGADVGSKASNKWVLVYLGVPNTPGTKTGLNYTGGATGIVQEPSLPFTATHHVRWKASGDYTNIQVWDAGTSAWTDSNIALIPAPVVAQQGTFMEMSITRASIGATGLIDVHMNMLIEGGGADWTYAGVPSTSFTDQKNPAFTKYFEFDLTNTTKGPSAYSALP